MSIIVLSFISAGVVGVAADPRLEKLALMGIVHNFGGLVAARFMLGLAEGIYRSFVAHHINAYTPRESDAIFVLFVSY